MKHFQTAIRNSTAEWRWPFSYEKTEKAENIRETEKKAKRLDVIKNEIKWNTKEMKIGEALCVCVKVEVLISKDQGQPEL